MKCTNCSHDVRPVVALDIDNTLADWTGAFISFLADYTEMHPREVARWRQYNGETEFSDWLQIDKKEYQAAKLAFRAGGFKRWMPAFPGAQRLAAAAWGAGCEVWVTTTRPWMRMDSVDPDTREWLHRNSIPYHHLMFDEEKYMELIRRVEAERVVFVLDDQVDQLREAWSFRLPSVLRETRWNRGVSWAGPRCATLAHATSVMRENLEQWRLRNGSE